MEYNLKHIQICLYIRGKNSRLTTLEHVCMLLRSNRKFTCEIGSEKKTFDKQLLEVNDRLNKLLINLQIPNLQVPNQDEEPTEKRPHHSTSHVKMIRADLNAFMSISEFLKAMYLCITSHILCRLYYSRARGYYISSRCLFMVCLYRHKTRQEPG